MRFWTVVTYLVHLSIQYLNVALAVNLQAQCPS